MTATLGAARPVTPSLQGEDERSLLMRLGLLLEREEELLEARDAEGLAAVAQVREQLIERLAAAARKRAAAQKRIGTVQADSTAEVAELVELYQRLRHRHEVRARVIRRHGERNTSAASVLAQASGSSNLYGSDGRVTTQRAAA